MGDESTLRVAVVGHSDGAETALDASIQPAPPGQPVYRAAIVISAQPLISDAATPNPPMLVIQGDADPVNPPSRGYRTWQDATSPKDLEVLHGAGHLQPLEPGSQWLPVVERVTDAFLDAYLLRDASPAAITHVRFHCERRLRPGEGRPAVLAAYAREESAVAGSVSPSPRLGRPGEEQLAGLGATLTPAIAGDALVGLAQADPSTVAEAYLLGEAGLRVLEAPTRS